MVDDLLLCAVIMTVIFSFTLIWLRFADPLRAGRAASPLTFALHQRKLISRDCVNCSAWLLTCSP
jgi:hypothetical protein